MNQAMTEPKQWPGPEYRGDEVNAGMVALVGLFAAVVFLLIVVLLQAWFYSWKGEIASARAAAGDPASSPLGLMVSEQEQQIDSYHWVNRERGIRAIPIERAMALVAEELAAAPKDRKGEAKDGKGN
jgi:hypothetical protein